MSKWSENSLIWGKINTEKYFIYSADLDNNFWETKEKIVAEYEERRRIIHLKNEVYELLNLNY